MKTLPTEFERNNFEFKQLAREGNVALYHRKSKSLSYAHFEIIRVQSHNGYEIAGNVIPAAEVYPGANSWGTYGLTKTDEADARAAYAEWVEKYGKETNSVDPSGAKKAGRGRKPLDVELVFPKGEFTVADLIKTHKTKDGDPVSAGYIHVHLQPHLQNGTVQCVRKVKLTKGRGKPTNLYKYFPATPEPAAKLEARVKVAKAVKKTKKVAAKPAKKAVVKKTTKPTTGKKQVKKPAKKANKKK